MGSRNPSKIEKTPSLDPKISFLMLRGTPGSSHGPPGCKMEAPGIPNYKFWAPKVILDRPRDPQDAKAEAGAFCQKGRREEKLRKEGEGESAKVINSHQKQHKWCAAASATKWPPQRKTAAAIANHHFSKASVLILFWRGQLTRSTWK
jgi:hypothetical protein